MAGDQEIRCAVGDEAQRLLSSISRRIEQMQTADDRVYTFDSGNPADVGDGVDQPVVAAAGQNQQPVAGLEPHRQFVADEVGMVLFCIEKKWSAGVFKNGPSWNRAADSDRWRQIARQDAQCGRATRDLCAGVNRPGFLTKIGDGSTIVAYANNRA